MQARQNPGRPQRHSSSVSLEGTSHDCKSFECLHMILKVLQQPVAAAGSRNKVYIWKLSPRRCICTVCYCFAAKRALCVFFRIFAKVCIMRSCFGTVFCSIILSKKSAKFVAELHTESIFFPAFLEIANRTVSCSCGVQILWCPGQIELLITWVQQKVCCRVRNEH